MKSILKLSMAAALLYASGLNAQSNLSGKVVSTSGEPVPYATIGIKNTQLATVADANGLFLFKSIRNGRYILIAKSVGYPEAIDTIDISADKDHAIVLKEPGTRLDEVVVNSTRVDKGSGMAFNNVDAETLKKQNLGQDAPYMLAQLPGVVVNSDAGNGVGYTGLRIRGTDGTRINVTINGVPINDAESQGTFFVDMPDLVSSVNNIQVQRGVGSSVNGAGAFGASINFQTNQLNEKPYANVISTAGSYNTFRNTIAAGTGLLNNHFAFDGRASRITSDGYIDRASSRMHSFYLAGGYYGKKSVVKLIHFSGTEKTYQAWNLVNEDSIKNGNRTYNEVGAYTDSYGNRKYYKNETDNYLQHNSQLHFIHTINSRLHFNLTGHYTKGKGYYEQYREDEYLPDYGMNSPVVLNADSTNITTSDLIRRRWLDNDFAGAIFNLNYTQSSVLSFVLGGGYNTYFGKHFGRVLWAQYSPELELDRPYYSDAANKNDANIYLKTNYKVLTNLNVFADLQVRRVDYRFRGFNDQLETQDQQQVTNFFNPKLGFSYDLNQNFNVYASVAMANKEPNRDDFVQSTPQSRPRHESLTDLEAGAKFAKNNFLVTANFYNMQYKDQLVLNGRINDVGAYNRVNVKSSYRRGIELEMSTNLSKYFTVGGNIALSENKIADFDEYIDSAYSYFDVDSVLQYDGYTQSKKSYTNTDISFSPKIVSSAILTVKPFKGFELSFIGKYVGRQYLDNTSNVNRSISPYGNLDIKLNYIFRFRNLPEISCMLAAFNVLNKQYETNGYTYSYYYDSAAPYTFNYKAPVAPLNFLGGVSVKF